MSVAAKQAGETLMVQLHPGALVVEAAEGVFRTVSALKDRNQWWVALLPDNPLCPLLTRAGMARVMEADGAAFHVRAQDASSDALAGRVLALVADRLAAHGGASAAAPRLFRLVLDRVALADEPSPRPCT